MGAARQRRPLRLSLAGKLILEDITLYAYEIGYYSHEESHYIQLMHEERFSAEQLEEMVLALVPEIAERVWDDSLDPDLRDLDDDYSDIYPPDRARLEAARSRLRIDFPDLMRGVYESDAERYVSSLRSLLCERHGFQPLTFEASYTRWGWGDLVAGDWDYEDHDEAARSRLVAATHSALRGYLERHPEAKERFGITDVDEFIKLLHDSRLDETEG